MSVTVGDIVPAGGAFPTNFASLSHSSSLRDGDVIGRGGLMQVVKMGSGGQCYLLSSGVSYYGTKVINSDASRSQ